MLVEGIPDGYHLQIVRAASVRCPSSLDAPSRERRSIQGFARMRLSVEVPNRVIKPHDGAPVSGGVTLAIDRLWLLVLLSTRPSKRPHLVALGGTRETARSPEC